MSFNTHFMKFLSRLTPMPHPNNRILAATCPVLLLTFLLGLTSQAADVTWNGATNTDWMTGTNWSNSTAPVQGDAAIINSGTPVFSSGTTPGYNAIRQYGGTVAFSGGTFNCANNSAWESRLDATLLHTGTLATINSLEIGRSTGATGLYTLSGGNLKISRGHSGTSLYLGTNRAAGAAGTGTLEISGGTFTTRAGVKLGDATAAGTGKFTVLGSVIDDIGIGKANTDTDGTWVQNTGSTLKVGIDPAGVRKIVIKDSATATTGTSAIFASGALLDVGYYNSGWGIGSGGGTWTVMEVENGPITDNGLAFASGVNTSIWSKVVDNSGPNGKLIITATGTVPTGNVYWTGTTSSDWATATNWSDNIGLVTGVYYAYITGGTPTFSTGTSFNLRGIRLWGGTLTVSGGTFTANAQSSAETHFDSAMVQSGGVVDINALEIGRTAGKTGSVVVSGGSFTVGRSTTSGGITNSLYIGSNRSTAAGTGSFEISGGSLVTRTGVKLGLPSNGGFGKFTVLGSSITQIGIAASNTDGDGTWVQNAGSTLKVGIDFGGVTKIYLKDGTGTTGPSATFASGSLLDVGYYNTGYGGGTWTVMEVENGQIIDNGLAFAPGVNTAVWSFSIDNSGPNGVLKVTAAGTPAAIDLTVGNTLKQKMRYGLDYERLWYWSGSTANKNTVARWSMVDCDVDYIRVAMVCGYELTEGTYDLTAYTDKVIPMMQAMKAAKPDIKFFATPRPLNEDVSNAAWQPYPIWITGASSYTSTTFAFNWQKCAEYLVRYINLMKSYGFKISYMDLTNEWNYVDSGDYRDIKAYMVANLAAEDIPLLVGPSAWNYTQGASWLSGATTASRKDAVAIASCHNTDKTGTAQDFADRAGSILPGKEVWNSEVHGWKSTSGADEVLSSAYMFECIRAGFSGLNGWLAIGTANQGHSYILNENSTVTRNVKYFIFRKLSTTSNYGYALDINQPAELSVGIASDQADAGTSTSALIRGNLMTVWVMNHSANSLPIRINPTGRTLSETKVKRTRWSEAAGLAVEGVADSVPATSNTSVWSTIAGNSVYCYELLLNPTGVPYAKIEAEAFSGQSGTTNETCADTGAGQDVTSISHNDWLRFDSLNLGLVSSIRLRVARAAGSPDSRIEVRQDSITGTVLGSIAVPETGGWQTWETIETALTPATGLHSIYLKFVENGSSLGTPIANLNWLQLILPTTPTNLASTPVTTTQITLTWPAVTGAASYQVSRSTALAGTYTMIASGLTATTYTDTGLTGGTRYYYTIRAVFSGVASADSTVISSVTSGPILPANTAIGTVGPTSNGSGGSHFSASVPQSGVGQFYQMIGTDDLTAPVWTEESPVYQGNGGPLDLQLAIPPGTTRHFYKVKVWRE